MSKTNWSDKLSNNHHIALEHLAPGEVTGLTVTTVSSESDRLRATWIAPIPPCAKTYDVWYQLTNFDQCDATGGDKEFFQTTADTSITVDDLRGYSTYKIFVAAKNTEGDSNQVSKTETTVNTGKPKG